MSHSSFASDPRRQPLARFAALLIVLLAVALLLARFDPRGLPFQPGARYSDAATSHWPAALHLRRAVLDDHTFPLWRPLLMGGQPFAANPLNKVWYPPQWLALLLPPAWHLNTLIVLHLLAAGLGAWVWGRATGLRSGPAALFGVAYMLAPRLTAALGAGHLDLLYAAAWFPWLLWAVRRVTERQATLAAVGWLGVTAALCFLADVRLCAYAFVTAGAYAGWRWFIRRRELTRRQVARTLLLVGSGGLLAASLTAMQWVPLVLLRGDLSRGDLTLDDAATGSLVPGQWLGLLIGDHGGGPETLVYVGVSVLLLAGVAVWLRPRRFGFWAGVVLVAALYALGEHGPLWPALNRAIPALRWWRVPGRAWLVAALILPYLAGWGAQLLADRPLAGRRARLAAAALVGGGLACSLASRIALVPPLESTAALGVLALPAAGAVLLAALIRPISAQALVAALIAIVALDLLWIDRALVEWRGEESWLTPHEALATVLREDGAIRVYSPSYSVPQQAAAYWDIALFGGVDPFQRAAFIDAAAAATGIPAMGYSVTIPPLEVAEDAAIDQANRTAVPDADLLAQWLVTHVAAGYPLEAEGLAFAARVGDVYVYRNTRAPDAALTWQGPNQATVALNEPVEGPLYAVAASPLGGMGGSDQLGLPGEIEGEPEMWTFRAEPDEIVQGLAAAAVCGVLAALAAWGARRV